MTKPWEMDWGVTQVAKKPWEMDWSGSSESTAGTTDDRPIAQNWQPTLLESMQGVFGANKERASNELAARRIAERDGISTSKVYESVGGHQPMLNPEGRNPAVALTEGAEVIAKQAPDILPSIENTALRSIRGGRETVADETWLDRAITATDRPPPDDADPNYAKLQGLGKSAGYSLTTMGASLGAGIPASMATTPAGGVAAGMAASGAVSFRGSKDEFLDQALKKMNADSMKRNGRPINQVEWDDAREKLNTAANKYGAWEAIPEAVGNAVLLGTITKGLKGALIGQGSEQATETITGVGQNRAEYEAGLTKEKIGIDEAWRNQALQTALLAGGMQAAGAGLNATKNALFGKASKPNQENPEVTQNIYADQSPPPPPSGLDMNAVVDRMIGAESAGKADAKNPLSSAEGLGQFIDSTWLKMVKKHRPDVASGKSDQDILDLKTNGALSREMTARYAEDNMQELQSSGFEATGRNVYLAHHFGAGGARSLLRADPNIPVASVVSAQVIQQNPYMRGKTVGQVLDFIGNKMGEQAGSVSSAADNSETTTKTDNIFQGSENLLGRRGENIFQRMKDYDARTINPADAPPALKVINPIQQTDNEANRAARAPIDTPTAPSSSDSLVETVQNVAAKPIEPATVEAAQTEVVPTPSADPTSEVQPVVNEPAPLADLNQAQAAPAEPVLSIEPVEAMPTPVAVDEPKLFSVAADEAEQFRVNLDKALSDRRSVDVPIALGKPSSVLQAVGIPDLPVVVTRDTIRKASNEVKHNVPVEVIRQLPELMADPIMVFDSADAKAGGSVVLVEATDKDNRSVMVAVHVNKQKGFSQVNQIASIYGRERDGDFVRWMNEGRLRYIHQQKSQQWSLSRGLQLPKEIGTAGGKTKILTNEDIVKRSQQSPSTGRTRSGLSVSEAQAELAAKLGDARVKRLLMLGKLVFADNPPVEGVQGSYQNGTVTLYPDNIEQGKAWSVFLHEAGEHASLEKMLGAEKYAFVVSSFDKLVESGNADAVRAVERVPGDTPQQQVASERLAYLIEDFTNNTLKTGGAKNLVRRLIAALRAWAFDKLPAWARPRELSVADIQALAVRAARGWVSSITAETGSDSQVVEKQEAANDSEALYSIKSITKAITTPNQQRNADGLLQMGRFIINEVIASPPHCCPSCVGV
ncbi:MAG: hypothetical protein ACH34X_18190 [Thiolinea sp.]